MEKYIVRMSQDSFWDVEVEAENHTEAMLAALKRCYEGGATPDHKREWGDMEAIRSTPAPKEKETPTSEST